MRSNKNSSLGVKDEMLIPSSSSEFFDSFSSSMVFIDHQDSDSFSPTTSPTINTIKFGDHEIIHSQSPPPPSLVSPTNELGEGYATFTRSNSIPNFGGEMQRPKTTTGMNNPGKGEAKPIYGEDIDLILLSNWGGIGFIGIENVEVLDEAFNPIFVSSEQVELILFDQASFNMFSLSNITQSNESEPLDPSLVHSMENVGRIVVEAESSPSISEMSWMAPFSRSPTSSQTPFSQSIQGFGCLN